MPTDNEKLRDFEVTRQIALLRVASGGADTFVPFLQDADRDLSGLLFVALGSGEILNRSQRSILRRDIRLILATQDTLVGEGLEALLEELSEDEVEAQVNVLGRVIGAGVVGVAVALAFSRVKSTPMDGVLLADWRRRLGQRDFERVWQSVLGGISRGDPADQIVRAVIGSRRQRFRDGVRATSRRNLRSLVTTSVVHAATVSRELVWGANKEIVGAFWVSILDNETCPICASLDGRRFKLGKGPRPPVHPRCRCTTSPILRGVPVPDVISYGDWLRTRSNAFQDGVLGLAKAKLFRDGLDINRFVDSNLNILTLEQLRRLEPLAFQEVGL